jgi:N-acetylneuraminate synthase
MYDFSNLFIFEMANSHQGSVEHGKNIIKELAKIKRAYNIKAAVKLQYRNLDTFIHPDYKGNTTIKHISRFESTKLSFEQFSELVAAIKSENLIAMSTPFDEIGVEWCMVQDLEIIKIASCSALDWPLLEKTVAAKKPVIISTGGKSLQEIDNIYNFFSHRNCDFGLMHCIAEYPASKEKLQLDFIDSMVRRYRDITIGYSGHEDPDDNIVASLAYARGAKFFERHVGLPTETIKLNAYSMNPEQTEEWVSSILNTINICSVKGGRTKYIGKEEVGSLRSLMRGVFANKNIKSGSLITKNDVFFAMPCLEEQIASGKFDNKGIIATKDYRINEAIKEMPIINEDISLIRNVIHDAKGLLSEAGIVVGNTFEVELSHHYGIKRIREFGAIIVNIINREYCKKYIIMLPGQTNPSHYHKQKEETFQILYGILDVENAGVFHSLKSGDILTVYRGDDHSFLSKNGAVFEEISTTHIKNDSFYEDEKIAQLDVIERKTIIKDW